MNEITLEKITDIKALSEFASGIWHEFWNNKISNSQIEYMLEKFQSEKAIKEQIKTENYVYFYVLSGGETAGYTGLSFKDDYLFLSKIYLKKEFRHKGIGTEAFEAIKDYAEKNGKKRIRLTVKKDNQNSIEAYKKWNFKIVDAVITDIGGGFVMDDYIMEYNF